MRREIIEIDERFGKEFAGRYVFEEISWARRSRIIQKHTRYNPLTGEVVSADYSAPPSPTNLFENISTSKLLSKPLVNLNYFPSHNSSPALAYYHVSSNKSSLKRN